MNAPIPNGRGSLRMRLLVGAVLFLSLAANLFMAGWLLGSGPAPEALPEWGQRRTGQGPLRGMLAQARAMPGPEGVEVRAILRRQLPPLRRQMRALRQAREAVRAEFAAAELSRPAAEAALTRLREESDRLQGLAQGLILELGQRLPPETRVRLLERSLERGMGGADRSHERMETPP